MPVRRLRPEISDPYPVTWSEISDFRYVSRLALGRDPRTLYVRKGREASYVTLEPYRVEYRVDGEPTSLTVPAGMLTDLTSVPRIVRNIIGRVGPHLEAAIVHDFLYIAWQLIPRREARKQDWRFANEVMFAGLRAAGVNMFQRGLIQAALRPSVASWLVYRSRDDGLDGMGLFVDLTAS